MIARTRRQPRWVAVLVLALLAGICLLGFIVAPVREHTATYSWDSEQPEFALPLNPYRPAELTVTAQCADLAAVNGTALDTVRAVDPGLGANRLQLRVSAGTLTVASGARRLGPVPLQGCRTVVIGFDTHTATIVLDGRPVAEVAGDLRPAVDGFFVPAGTRGLSAEIVADTQFDTSPTAWKLVLAGTALALLAAALALIWRADGPRRTRRRWSRPGMVDAIVGLSLVAATAMTGATDDDGFIAQIARTPLASGYIGNYVRWNNAPEAPFGWFYQVYAWWGQISVEPVWLRLPALMLGILSWLVLRHQLLPRTIKRPSRTAIAGLAAAFVLLWIVYGNSLRPENLFALGLGVVIVLVDEGVRRRRLFPLAVAAVVAGWTTAVGPTGLVAVTPFVVAGARSGLGRQARRTPLAVAAVAALGLAGFGSAVLGMFADQSLAAVMTATRARTAYGPVFPIWMDPRRYWMLFMSFAARQISVYLPAAAMAYVGWRWRRERLPGIRNPMVRQIVGAGLGLVVAMALSPTKLPHHFGALIIVGPAAMALAVESWRRMRPSVANPVFAGATVVLVGLAMLRDNTWWKLSSVGMLFDRNPLRLGPVLLAWPVITLGVVVGVGGWLWIRRRGDLPGRRRWMAVLAWGVALFTVCQYLNFAQAMAERGRRYTLGAAAAYVVAGKGCLLERSLWYERDPATGVLQPETGHSGRGFDRDGDRLEGLKVWQADPQAPDAWQTPWYRIPESVRRGDWPLVVSVAGLDAGHRVRIVYDTGFPKLLKATRKTLGTSLFSDIRVHPPTDAPKAARFRLELESDGPAVVDRNGALIPFAVSQPRVPITRPLLELAQRSEVAVAWNLAFFAPCLDQPAIHDGRVEIADFILSDSEQPGNMTYHSRSGGPFAGVLGLTEAYRVPIYARDDYTEASITALDLVELVPRFGSEAGTPERRDVVRQGWQRTPPVP